jgi:hypothetical protein
MNKEVAKKVSEIQRELTQREFELSRAITFREGNRGHPARIEIKEVDDYFSISIAPPCASICAPVVDECIKALQSRVEELQNELDAI